MFTILFLSFLVYGHNKSYQLLIHELFKGEILYDINLINEEINNNNYHYYGSLENIKNIVNKKIINTEILNDTLKELNYPLIYILEQKYIDFINYFPAKTTFIVFNELVKFLKFGNQTIFSINNQRKLSFFQHNFENGYYYAKIGKKVDISLNNFFYLIIILSLIISILIGFILTKTLKNLGHSNNKIIYLLICITSYLLIGSNIINAVYFLFFKNREYSYTLEYTTLLIYSFYKSNIISILILVLLGWGTIFFYLGNTFKKINKYLFLIDLVCSISIPLSVYFINFTCKLNLFYIKNCIEYLLLFCINVFSLFKRVIPLANQMKYEQRIGSNQFNCIAFKYNKLMLINIIIAIYTIFFIFTPFLDKIFMKYYVNNYNYYFIFQLLYETIFFIFFFIIFFPKELPDYYFNDIVFKYKS